MLDPSPGAGSACNRVRRARESLPADRFGCSTIMSQPFRIRRPYTETAIQLARCPALPEMPHFQTRVIAQLVHVDGAFLTTKAALPHMRKFSS
jgi:hypothetical protein